MKINYSLKDPVKEWVPGASWLATSEGSATYKHWKEKAEEDDDDDSSEKDAYRLCKIYGDELTLLYGGKEYPYRYNVADFMIIEPGLPQYVYNE